MAHGARPGLLNRASTRLREMWEEAKDAAAGHPGTPDSASEQAGEALLPTLPVPKHERESRGSTTTTSPRAGRAPAAGASRRDAPSSTKQGVRAAANGGRRYEDLTVAELRKLAAKRDISGRSQMKKADLVRALQS